MRIESGGVVAFNTERNRQIIDEGWTPEHDDDHEYGELVLAATAYAEFAHWQIDPQHGWTETMIHDHILENHWPWDETYWKPDKDPQRNLVKAGALLAAEYDRVARKHRRESEAIG